MVGSHGYVECYCQIIEGISEGIVSGLGTQHRWWQPGTPLNWDAPWTAVTGLCLCQQRQLLHHRHEACGRCKAPQLKESLEARDVHLGFMEPVIKVYTCFFNMMKETLFIIEKLHIILFGKRYIVNFRPFSKAPGRVCRRICRLQRREPVLAEDSVMLYIRLKCLPVGP